MTLDHAQPLDGPATLKQRQVREHRLRRLVTPARIGLARLDDHLVQFNKLIAIGKISQQRRRFGKGLTILSSGDFVKDLAQTVDVRLRRTGPFRRNEAFGPHERLGLAHVRHQPDVRQLRDAVAKNDVRRLDIAVNQTAFVQMAECRGQRESQLQAFLKWKPAPPGNLRADSLGDVGLRLQVSRWESGKVRG